MRLGLIAMSGIRVHDDELTRLGLTLPAFIERSKVIASLPSLGLLTLAGMTPSDVDLEYVEVADIAEAPAILPEYDVVAISSYSAQMKEAYELADRYRNTGTRVVLGGLHVTARPKEALKHADSIVIGEGEPVWPQIIRDLKSGHINQIYNSRSTPFNLADAPLPRFELLEPERYNRLTVQTQRGCVYDCEFCASSIRLSPTYRVKPTEKVIEEIRHIKRLWPNPFVEFADDNSFVNKKHSKELVRAIEKENVRWFTETDISIAEDDELLSLLRDSGCAQVLIGLESTSITGLTGIERKTDWKAKQYDSYLRSIEKIQSHGISVNGCFVMGLDGTGPESFDDVFKFVRESGLYEVQVTIMTAFPGTPLYDRLKHENRIVKDKAWELCTLFDINFRPQNMTITELKEGFRNLLVKLYSESETTRRRQSYYNQLRKVVHEEHLG